MSTEQYRMNNNMYYTVEPYPFKYGGLLSNVQQEDISRVNIYLDDQLIIRWDVYITDDTRYTIGIEVAPNYRLGQWIDIWASADAGTMEQFSRPKVVWLNSGKLVKEQEIAMKRLITMLHERGIMRTGKVYAHGDINNVTTISEWVD